MKALIRNSANTILQMLVNQHLVPGSDMLFFSPLLTIYSHYKVQGELARSLGQGPQADRVQQQLLKEKAGVRSLWSVRPSLSVEVGQ